jgi:hypothetical protein
MAFTQQAFLHREDRPQHRTDGWSALFLNELCELRHVPLACAGLCSSEYVEAKTREIRVKSRKAIKANVVRTTKKPLCVRYAEVLRLRQILSQSSKPPDLEVTFALPRLQSDLPQGDRGRDDRLDLDAC